RGLAAGLALAIVAVVVSTVPAGASTPKCTKADVPDLKFTDTNCDGIDGSVKRAIFVAPTGNDASAGTMKQPLRTLPAAVRKASQLHKDVYGQTGSSDVGSGLAVVSDVSLYGGFNARWKRSATYRAVIHGAPQAIVGVGVQRVLVQLLTATASAAPDQGLSVYGVRLVRSSVR